ncbi:C40 family peptidase [Blastococcus aurantiacus]|uniref:C40 family peptidase n=1 Tax=Blastococcus aurantiacus TaxID=1550231 RepID=UPI0021015AFC|nr:C40 family peptidase [Blastococcus aurantiacus]
MQSRIVQIQGQLASFATSTAASRAGWAGAALAAGLTPTPAASASPLVAPATSAASASGTKAGAAIVTKAQEYLGVPYLWGGTNPSKGLDCSGFTQLVYRSQGVELPRVSAQQATAGRAVPSLEQAQPGDLLFFDYSPSRPGIDHVGIYVGDGQMIAAPQPGEVVKLQAAGQPSLIRRVLPDGAA